MLEKMIIIPAVAMALSSIKFATNESEYLNKISTRTATLEHERKFNDNNRDILYVSIGSAIATALIAYGTSKEKRLKRQF